MKEINKIYTVYAKDVFRYSYFKLRNKEEAEDVTSETFLRAINSRISQPDNVKLFLIGIARNVVYEKYRENKKSTTLSEKDSDNVKNDENLDNYVVQDELHQIVRNQLAKLESKTAEVIILKNWEDLSFKDIAKITNSNENSVKTLYYRGLDEMKLQIEKNSNKAKLHVFTLPALLTVIGQIKFSSEFSTSATFLGSINSLIKSKSIMDITQTVFYKTILGKVLIGTFAGVSTVSGVSTGAYIVKQNVEDRKQDEKILVEATPVIVEPTDSNIVRDAEKFDNNCTYSNPQSLDTISFSIPDEWTCTENNPAENPFPYSLSMEGDGLKLYIGFLFAAPDGNERVIYSSDNILVKEWKTTQSDTYGEIRGEFLNYSGPRMQIRVSNDQNNIDLNQNQLDLMKKILDSYSFLSDSTAYANECIYKNSQSGNSFSLKIPDNWSCREYIPQANEPSTYSLQIEGDNLKLHIGSLFADPVGNKSEILNTENIIFSTWFNESTGETRGEFKNSAYQPTQIRITDKETSLETTLTLDQLRVLSKIFNSYKEL